MNWPPGTADAGLVRIIKAVELGPPAQPDTALYAVRQHRSGWMSIVRADGLDLYDGVACAPCRYYILHDGVDVAELRGPPHHEETTEPWTYMKFPYLRSLGPGRWLVPRRPARTGAQLQPYSQRRGPGPASFLAYGPVRTLALPLGAHDRDAARHGSDCRALLRDDALLGGTRYRCPRSADPPAQKGGRDRGTAWRLSTITRSAMTTLVSWCSLIVGTTHSNQAMNESVRANGPHPNHWARDHRRAAQPHRSGHPAPRPLPELRHACAGQHASGGRRRRHVVN